MDWRGRIVADPNVLVGKPVIRGTRLAVELILELLANGWTQEEILANHPGLTREDIQACLAYATEVVRSERGSGKRTGSGTDNTRRPSAARASRTASEARAD